MKKQFRQMTWGSLLKEDLDDLIRLAFREDNAEQGDLTSQALMSEDLVGRAEMVVRQPGVIAGLPAVRTILASVDRKLVCFVEKEDGDSVERGDTVARIEGPARSLLRAERPMLNLLSHLSGIATLTRAYVDRVAGTRAQVHDTRKTTPGWRRLEKYAVGCGGGANHRTGLFDAILIKDNHLALGVASSGQSGYTPAEAVRRAHAFLQNQTILSEAILVEIEVDSLEQLEEVLPAGPDIVLLDNMTPALLRSAIEIRDSLAPNIELEASGGVNLETIRAIAETGVERISIGALTHSAICLDIGLDWQT